jgi:beta-phosphoglucomutase-like phosphatase (HAD superfamily)
VRSTDCVVIGDSESDVLAGVALGVRAVLLRSASAAPTAATSVQPSLAAAVEWLLGPVNGG